MKTESAFTLVEMLVVIAIIAIIAGMVVGLAGNAGAKKNINRVKTEMAALETAIDSYKAKLGFYPPDGTTNTLAPLFYELTGTKKISDTQYQTVNGNETITIAAISSVFGRQGFANSNPEGADNFFKEVKAGNQYRLASVNGNQVELMIVPVDGTVRYDSADGKPGAMNVWRYNSSKPVHNPGEYDLWAEIIVAGKTNIIGNWKE